MIQIKNLKKEKPSQPYDFIIDRSTVFGNIFHMDSEEDRDYVCDKYQEWFDKEGKDLIHLSTEFKTMQDAFQRYGKVNLFCHCYPKRCHGQTIAKYLEGRTVTKKQRLDSYEFEASKMWGKPTDLTKKKTKEFLDWLLEEYNAGQPVVSDSEYDKYLEKYLQLYGADKRPYLRSKQSTAVNDVVGTLSKCFGVSVPFRDDQKCYKDWVKGESFGVLVQPKFDGCSIAFDLNLKRFFTRGNYDDGEAVDVTELFTDRISCFKDIKADSMKFEAVMDKALFKQLNLKGKDGKSYVDARSAVSGIITSRNIDVCKYIDLIPLRILDGNKQYPGIQMYDRCILQMSTKYDTIQDFVTRILEDGATFTLDEKTYDVDGVVVSRIRDSGNDRTPLIDPNKEVAIKILNDVKTTKLIDVEYQFGTSGRITPVAKLEPIEFDGRIIKSPTLSTLERVVNMNLKYGDTVRVTYNIVPYLLDSLGGGTQPIRIPDKCPVCGGKWDMSTLKQVKCRNQDCSGLKLGSIIRYCKKMNMFGVSDGVVTKLWEAGVVTCIADLYSLTVESIMSVDGFKEKSAQNIVNEIAKSSTNVDLHKWLGAWPMDDISAKTWLMIIDQGTKNWTDDGSFKKALIGSIQNGTLMNFMEWVQKKSGMPFTGLGDITWNRILSGCDRNGVEMDKVIQFITFKTGGAQSIGTVCLTGTRNKRLIERLVDQGYVVTDNLTKTCDVLLDASDGKSSKVEKAHKFKVPVFPINGDGDFSDFELKLF